MIVRVLFLLGWTGCFAWAQAPAEGLVEVGADSIPGIVIEMRYATEKNITGIGLVQVMKICISRLKIAQVNLVLNL
ncbi:MAG: hypothetical protein EBY81_03440 [Verrucomicrobia bacterium]|nr:hypothetical protein [Verrucomicrobiota bacterium]